MAWIVQDKNDELILKEIYKQTDRGAVLIATAYLEERLVAAIKARTNRNQAIENRLYMGAGPLASFSAKIDLGLLLGIYEQRVHRFLRTVKDIRNAFAHNPNPINFETQKIKDLCATIDLNLHTQFELKPPGGEIKKVEIDLQSDGNPKTAFFNAIQFLLLLLDFEVKIAPPRVPSPPVFPPPE